LRTRFIMAGALTLALSLGGATAAMADTTAPPPDPDTTSVSMPMVVKKYDREVAAANGYEIVTNSDGTESSVPVTAAAIAQQARADEARANTLVQARSDGPDAWGDCGGSGISAVKKANDQLAWHTWFTVFGAATGYSWNVSASGAITGNSWHMSGNGPASGSKSFDGGGTVIGPDS
jgi:hypothetical protein